jgi:hypothetical protein
MVRIFDLPPNRPQVANRIITPMLRHLLALVICSRFVVMAQTPTLEQSLSNKSVSNAEISPDGRYVAYLVTQADWDENDFVSQI